MFCEYPQGYYTLCTRPLHAWGQRQHSSSCVGRRFRFQFERFVRLTSGVDDCYVKPDIPKQIFSITRAVAQGAQCCLDDELPGLFFMSEDKVRVYVPFVRVEPEEGSLGSPKFFVPCSPPVRAHGLDFDLNLDKLTRHSRSGVRDTNMTGAPGGAASGSSL